MRAAALGLVLALTSAACEGDAPQQSQRERDQVTEQAATGAASVPRAEAASELERAVRAALRANHRLSVRVLETNKIPPEAKRSTRGPALAALRSAAAERREQGVRVRLLRDRFRILSLELDPSYARASAVVLGRQRVQPYGANGQPLREPVDLSERARIELRRVGEVPRFVVWDVELVEE